MKKLVLSIFILFAVQVFAQKDLVVTMDTPVANQTIYAGTPFNLAYSLKNAGTTDIASTDSVVLGMVVGNQVVYAFAVNHGGITAGQTKTGSLNGFTLSFTTGAQNVDFCLLGTLRYGANLDSNLTNNVSCIKVNLSTSTGVEELAVAKSVNVFPNPASDVVNINYDYNKASVIRIYDITGKTVETIQVASGAASINVSAYHKGIYLFEITTADQLKIKSGRFSVTR